MISFARTAGLSRIGRTGDVFYRPDNIVAVFGEQGPLLSQIGRRPGCAASALPALQVPTVLPGLHDDLMYEGGRTALDEVAGGAGRLRALL